MTKSSKSISDIDRLIELASAEPAGFHTAETALAIDHSRSEGPSAKLSRSKPDPEGPRTSMWRILLQLRVLLPYLARLLPLLERGLLGTNLTGQPAKADTAHLERGMTDLQSLHQDLASQMKNQAGSIEYMQEQLTWIGKSLDKEKLKHEENAVALSSLRRMVTIWGIAVSALLIALIGLAVLWLVNRPS